MQIRTSNGYGEINTQKLEDVYMTMMYIKQEKWIQPKFLSDGIYFTHMGDKVRCAIVHDNVAEYGYLYNDNNSHPWRGRFEIAIQTIDKKKLTKAFNKAFEKEWMD